MPTRVDVDQTVVLEAVVAALIRNYPGGVLTDKTCYSCLEAEAPEDAVDDLYVTVSMADGEFNEGLFVGGGPKQCCENTGIIVAIWSRLASDIPSHDEQMLGNRNLGILKIKAKVLRALAAGQDNTAADLMANWPEGTGGVNTFLRQWLRPTSCSAPEKDKTSGYLGMAIRYQCDFDWDLTS